MDTSTIYRLSSHASPITDAKAGPAGPPLRKPPAAFPLVIAIVAWAIAVGAGSAALADYAHRPGRAAAAPGNWPTDSAVARARGATLVLAIHPLCPCTHATIAELARLMADARGTIDAQVLVVRHAGLQRRDGIADLAAAAAAIPGVSVREDPDGVEAGRFGALTSGQALLYDAGGVLRFNGGITGARGHEGDNSGRDAVARLARGESAAATHPVYGCPLFTAGDSSDACPDCHER
jgi:hypothetical protein